MSKFKDYPVFEAADDFDGGDDMNPTSQKNIDITLKDKPKDKNSETGEEEESSDEELIDKKIREHRDFVYEISTNLGGSLELLDETTEKMNMNQNFNGNFSDLMDAVETIRKFKDALDEEIKNEFPEAEE